VFAVECLKLRGIWMIIRTKVLVGENSDGDTYGKGHHV
jgi:hypothetical protein